MEDYNSEKSHNRNEKTKVELDRAHNQERGWSSRQMALDWNPQGSRTRGRPKSTWKRTVLEEIAREGKTWSEVKKLATNRFKVCHGSLYVVIWLVVEPREFNLPTLPQRGITYVPGKLPNNYGVHSEEYLPIRTVIPVVAGMLTIWKHVLREEIPPVSDSLTNKESELFLDLCEMMMKRDEVTGEWRKLHNTELHALYSSPDITRNIKSRRLRWAGHVARMGESRNAYSVLVGKPEGKRPLGRPRRRCEDIIKMDLREV
ncbi:hypothetical protein ANN_23068 [Periplaneta americana]|uniref:Uncharacterized protein n=1 Tax=Periplaneta americana TaxID=6978 RepID=A0ABQ8SL25_PERAM|nr:hypothetical protein ANN_23068 [Periplaneta americana]